MKQSFDPKLIVIALVAIVVVGAAVYFLAPAGTEEGGKEVQTAGIKPKDLEDNPNTPAGMGLDSGGSTPSGEAAGAADPNAAAGSEGQSAAAN
ncbi:MAG: hypothetical protein HONBIEJF_03040 [Fimbriimonadaceae bacterium]|nr:hypothetical protein [Fimbriimonadaceae bacterium]